MGKRLWLYLGVAVLGVALRAAEAPRALRCEWRVEPRGVRDPCPEFAWHATEQSACRVVVTRSEQAGDPVWDSGRVETRLPILEYAGPRLEDGVTYLWRVEVWDREGQLQPAAEAQSFTMAVVPMAHHLPTIRTFINFAGSPDFARDWLDLCFRQQAKQGRSDVIAVHYALVCTMVLPHPSTGKPLTGKAKALADFCVARGLTAAGILEDMFCHFARDTKVRLHVGRESMSCPIEVRVCPGWDARNDRNGDGNVDDREFGNLVNAEATAREPGAARIPIYYWGPPNDDFVMNVGHPAYQQFMATVHAPRVCEGWDGIYFDTVPTDVPDRGGTVVEYPRQGADRDQWLRDLQLLFARMKTVLPDKMITGNGWDAKPMVLDGGQSEGWQCLNQQASQWQARIDQVSERDRRGKVQLIQYNPVWHAELAEFGPKLPVTQERDQLFGLATYLLAHGDFTYFGFGRHPYRNVTKLWFEAMRHDLGAPVARYYRFAEVDKGSSSGLPDVLRNGGFEHADADDHPDVWQFQDPVAVDREVRHGGASSVRIASPDRGVNNFGNRQYVTLKPNTSYTLAAWAKVDAVSGKPGAQVYPYEFDDAEGRGMLTWTGTQDWKEQRMVFTTGADVEGRISYRMYGATGTVWFDDIRLLEGVAVKEPVFAREYTKGLVLVKPYVGGSFGDDTVTTHQLPGTFRPIRADGTLGDSVSSVALRNAEAVILVK